MQLRYGQQLDWLCAELQAMCKTYFLEKKSNAGITVPRKCDYVLIHRCPTFVSPEGDVVAALICHCTRDTLGHQHEWLSPCHHVRHHRACASRLSVLPLGSTSGPQFPVFQMICEEEKMENACPRQNVQVIRSLTTRFSRSRKQVKTCFSLFSFSYWLYKWWKNYSHSQTTACNVPKSSTLKDRTPKASVHLQARAPNPGDDIFKKRLPYFWATRWHLSSLDAISRDAAGHANQKDWGITERQTTFIQKSVSTSQLVELYWTNPSTTGRFLVATGYGLVLLCILPESTSQNFVTFQAAGRSLHQIVCQYALSYGYKAQAGFRAQPSGESNDSAGSSYVSLGCLLRGVGFDPFIRKTYTLLMNRGDTWTRSRCCSALWNKTDSIHHIVSVWLLKYNRVPNPNICHRWCFAFRLVTTWLALMVW